MAFIDDLLSLFEKFHSEFETMDGQLLDIYAHLAFFHNPQATDNQLSLSQLNCLIQKVTAIHEQFQKKDEDTDLDEKRDRINIDENQKRELKAIDTLLFNLLNRNIPLVLEHNKTEEILTLLEEMQYSLTYQVLIQLITHLHALPNKSDEINQLIKSLIERNLKILTKNGMAIDYLQDPLCVDFLLLLPDYYSDEECKDQIEQLLKTVPKELSKAYVLALISKLNNRNYTQAAQALQQLLDDPTLITSITAKMTEISHDLENTTTVDEFKTVSRSIYMLILAVFDNFNLSPGRNEIIIFLRKALGRDIIDEFCRSLPPGDECIPLLRELLSGYMPPTYERIHQEISKHAFSLDESSEQRFMVMMDNSSSDVRALQLLLSSKRSQALFQEMISTLNSENDPDLNKDNAFIPLSYLLLSSSDTYFSALKPATVKVAVDYSLLIGMSCEDPSKAVAEFQKFQDLYSRINRQAQEQHQVELPAFLSTYFSKLLPLLSIMGSSLFQFLRRFLAFTPQPLIRFLKSLRYLQTDSRSLAKQLFQKHQATLFRGNNQQHWEKLLLSLSVFDECSVGTMTATELSTIKSKLLEMSTIEEAKSYIEQQVNTAFVRMLNIKGKIDFDVFYQKIQDVDLRQLITARSAMANSYYKDVFDAMLAADFSPRPFREFLTDPNQTCEIGRKIAEHNLRIHEHLRQAGIKVDLALDFPKALKFSFDGDPDAINVSNVLLVIWNSLVTVYDMITTPEIVDMLEKLGVDKAKLSDMIKQIKELVLHITTDVTIDPSTLPLFELMNASNLSLAKVLHENLREIIKVIPTTDSTAHFIEHGRHLMQRLADLEKLTKQQDEKHSSSKKAKSLNFRIEMWSPEQFNTYYLGSSAYLGCCLAPDGGQFPAMIQRRLDQAMPIVVVIDQQTGLPVAGAWLCFVVTAQGALKVVANYFEINSKYGLKNAVRDLFMDMLLAYVGEIYVPAVGAKGLICRPLTYGYSSNYPLAKFPIEKTTLTKVGGFLCLDHSETDANVKARYYLNALDLDEFYRYEAHLHPVLSRVPFKFVDKTNTTVSTPAWDKAAGTPLDKTLQLTIVLRPSNMPNSQAVSDRIKTSDLRRRARQ